MRIHTVAALYVFVFSFFFEMTALRYAVLILTVCLVWMAELFNTAMEKLADRVEPNRDPVIGLVKDLSAGAVLVCAVGSVGVGIALFWQPQRFLYLWQWFCARPWMFALLAVVTALAVYYIVRGIPCRREKKERNNEGEHYEN